MARYVITMTVESAKPLTRENFRFGTALSDNPGHRKLLTAKTELTSIAKYEKPKAPKKPKPESRATRWSRLAGEAVAALEELESMRADEFEGWKDSLPENLANSALGEKLETICGIDLSTALETAQEAEGAEVPLGFGRD